MDVNICIIGAGVIGLAVARKLSEKHKDVVILERNQSFGQETSSRNSEVIHSGIYYKNGSLKATLCVRGNAMLYDYCRTNDIAHKNTGKLIISQSTEEDQYLLKLLQKAEENGVMDVEWLGTEEIKEIEPYVLAKSALLVPSTGIVDSHSLMKQLLTDALNQGVQLAYESEVHSIQKTNGGYKISTGEIDNGSFVFTAKKVINCAGLESDVVANLPTNLNGKYKLNFCKGEYFRIQAPKNKLVKRLIYPTPFKNLQGLGIHSTIDLDGGVKLGPNIIYLEGKNYDYSIDKSNIDQFFNAASAYFPFLEKRDLIPEMAGIRPKLQYKDGPPRDFIIEEESEAGLPGFINLVGIESPGLTSSLAIAEYISNMI